MTQITMTLLEQVEELRKEVKEFKEKKIAEYESQLKKNAAGIDELIKGNAEIRYTADELKAAEEKIMLLELQLSGFTGLRDSLRKIFDGIMPHLTPDGKTALDLRITKGDGSVDITTVPEKPREFTTDNERGRIVYILANHLQGKPSPRRAFLPYAKDEGWVDLPNFTKEAKTLVKAGVFIEGGNEKDVLYRFAGRIKVSVDGKPVGEKEKE